MPISHGLRAYPAESGDVIVLSDDTDRDGAQVSGRWVESDHALALEDCR